MTDLQQPDVDADFYARSMAWRSVLLNEIAPLYSDNDRQGIGTRFVIGLLLLKHIYGLSDEGVYAEFSSIEPCPFRNDEYVRGNGHGLKNWDLADGDGFHVVMRKSLPGIPRMTPKLA